MKCMLNMNVRFHKLTFFAMNQIFSSRNSHSAWNRMCFVPTVFHESHIATVWRKGYVSPLINTWSQAIHFNRSSNNSNIGIGYLLDATMQICLTSAGIPNITWWRHQMETFYALLALCAGNSPVTCKFPSQRPVKQSFGVLFDMRLSKRLSK